ncbi:hypothetical protein FHR24_001551 [Wenyingzhuangia heitensis]|uniref:Uncharacterized protein n=1 Tax=Wenyingzhuangia heitensis TaxID=1487859 RepID=A0ABX0U8D9_9FLAO|nr:DUF6452 family protein [Wenyingzhuangia heitensis]NIJ45112.1 hypothetical protein [Wenyingzhuangia heitensis]
MKKLLFSLLIITTFIGFNSCQDEFCLDNTTPSLVIEFYNNTERDSLKEIDLIVWANSKDTIFNGTVSKTGNLSLPLDTQNTFVVYHLSMQDELGNGTVDDLTINYTTEDIFVSQACGFKSIYNNVTTTTTKNNWILDSETTKQSINDETEAHVKIYH